MRKHFIYATAATLIALIAVPAALFAIPDRAEAQLGSFSCIGGLAAGLAAETTNLVISVPSGDLPTASATMGSYITTLGDCLYTYIVIPAAKGIMRQLLQHVTENTIAWINGTGAPGGQRSFVPNISVHLQAVGDSVASAFIGQLMSGFQSPFDMMIASSLRGQYLQESSMAGFFSQYRSTLSQVSPNVNALFAGNWAAGGGITSWLALTTQPQNNPYLLYQAAAGQLGSNLASAQTDRRQDLIQGGGFLSFCPPGSSSDGSAASPQAQCTDEQGVPVDATTPGSVIQSYLEANVNSGIGQLINAQDIDGALSMIVSAMVQRLGDSILSSHGLFGSTNTGRGSLPIINNNANGTQPANALSTAQQTIVSVDSYTASWNAIQTAATAAQTAVQAMQTSCTAELAVGTIGTVPVTSADVQAALATITSILGQAQTGLATASTTRAFAQRVIAEANSSSTNPTQLANDVYTLVSMPPSAIEVSQAQSDAATTGAARANPNGSITVSGGSMVDRMTLLSTNADRLKSQCTGSLGSTPPPPPPPSGG